MKLKDKRLISDHNGFTMIELIVVIIILSILAVTVAPKFFNSTGFQEYTYQAEVITKLRSIQLRAMQQTNNSNECHTVLVTKSALGIPKPCDSTLPDDWQGIDEDTGEGTTIIKIEDNHQVTFGPEFSFTFDSMGRPSCGTSCSINVTGDNSLTIKIESEGYIHEG
jgi:MSHA pilin protein MshC